MTSPYHRVLAYNSWQPGSKKKERPPLANYYQHQDSSLEWPLTLWVSSHFPRYPGVFSLTPPLQRISPRLDLFRIAGPHRQFHIHGPLPTLILGTPWTTWELLFIFNRVSSRWWSKQVTTYLLILEGDPTSLRVLPPQGKSHVSTCPHSQHLGTHTCQPC